MRKGLFLAILGALFVFIGLGVLNPLFISVLDGQLVPLFELEVAEEFVFGADLPLLQPIMVFALIGALAGLVGFFVRWKKRLAVTVLIFAVASITTMAYVHANAAGVMEAVLQDAGQRWFKGELVVVLEGPYFVYFGGLVMLLGALVVFAARPVFRAADRFLRVAVIWNGGVVREELFYEPRNITVGEPAGSTFVLPTALAAGLSDRLTLFRRARGRRYELCLTPQMRGELKLQNTKTTIEAYVKAHGGDPVAVEPGDWGIINIGELGLFFQFVRPERPVPTKGLAGFPAEIAASTTFSAVVQVSFVLATLFLWQETAIRRKARDIRKTMQVEVQTKEQLPEEELIDLGEEEDTTGKKAEGDEGKFGDPDIEPEVESQVPKRDGEMVAKIDPKKVGLNDLLSSSRVGKGAISDILSSDSSAFSNKLAVAMSGTGSEFVMGHGAGGLGFSGTGTGGGGTGGYGRIHGLGKIDTGGGVGVKASMGQRKARKVGKINLGSGASKGFCARGDIEKNVRLRAAGIRACYEEQLQVRPDLAGKLTVQWTIGTDGSVTQASVVSSSMNNKGVENCVLRVVRRIRFAKPEGGICIVNWPFVFNPA